MLSRYLCCSTAEINKSSHRFAEEPTSSERVLDVVNTAAGDTEETELLTSCSSSCYCVCETQALRTRLLGNQRAKAGLNALNHAAWLLFI
jgi:hypothetical protein